jgi:hypothetical protein
MEPRMHLMRMATQTNETNYHSNPDSLNTSSNPIFEGASIQPEYESSTQNNEINIVDREESNKEKDEAFDMEEIAVEMYEDLGKLLERLLRVANYLDLAGQYKSADVIDSTIKELESMDKDK